MTFKTQISIAILSWGLIACGEFQAAKPTAAPPPAPPPPTTGSATIQEKTGTRIGDGMCILSADKNHLGRAWNVWNQVYNYEPTEKGGSRVLLRSLENGIRGFKLALVAAKESQGQQSCELVSKAFYDFAYGLLQSMLLGTKALAMVGGLTAKEFYTYWEISQNGDSKELEAHVAKLGAELGTHLKDEGKVLAIILMDSFKILVNPSGADLMQRLDDVIQRIQTAQEKAAQEKAQEEAQGKKASPPPESV